VAQAVTCVTALLRMSGDFPGPACTDTFWPALDDHSGKEILHQHGVPDHEPHGHHPGRLGALLRHDHSHGDGSLPDDAALHATKVSLIGLLVTAFAQLAIVGLSGSVALLSDTVHNFADALTAIPLWVAFVLQRRPPNRRFTHGYNRAEDFAGLAVLTAIGTSAAFVIYESVTRLIHPRAMEHAGWVIAAGVFGALGNEFVARYRIGAGRRIGSAALTADGVHARTDALTSLVVVAAGVGALFGQRWADPVAGLVVALFIVLMLRHSAVRIFARMLDAVDPELVDLARTVTGAVPGVRQVGDLRLRWHGHQLQVVALASVDPQLTVEQSHQITQRVEHDLMHAFPYTVDAIVRLDPHGVADSHELTRHHL
jgi:cation diffusion facilitator family transporter